MKQSWKVKPMTLSRAAHAAAGGAVFVCVMGTTLLFCGGAMAQAQSAEPLTKTLGDSLPAAAKSDYEAARMLFDDNDFAGALVKFQRAYDHAHEPRLLWNMAVCEKNLRHYVNVQRLLERYQHEAGASMTLEDRAEVNDVLDTVRLLISTVHLSVRPEGAQVFVDEVLRGTAPLAEPLPVDLGARRIRISKPGYRDEVIEQHFAGGSEVTLAVSLSEDIHRGRLMIVASDSDSIQVDNQFRALGHWDGMLSSGAHSVRVTAPGKRPYTSELVMGDDQTRTLYVELEAEKSGVSPLIWLGTGVLVAGGLAAGGYFLLRPEPEPRYTVGTWDPGAVTVQ